METPYQIEVNGQWTFEMQAEEAAHLDAVRLGKDAYHVLYQHQPFEVRITAADFSRKTYEVEVNGNRYSARISDDLDQLIIHMGFELHTTRNISRIEAPMPGLILDIQVSPGQEVKEGDPLLVLEAMKMENVILSPRDGIIKKVAVQPGAAVEKKHLLVEFE
jgi:biotin carboxyl carrier protein